MKIQKKETKFLLLSIDIYGSLESRFLIEICETFEMNEWRELLASPLLFIL